MGRMARKMRRAMARHHTRGGIGRRYPLEVSYKLRFPGRTYAIMTDGSRRRIEFEMPEEEPTDAVGS